MNGGWSSAAHEAIGQLVKARTGLTFHPNRVTEAEAGIRLVMERNRVGDATSYLKQLECGGAELDELVTELTVTETYFFREPAHFDFIRSQVLPGLARSCASGQHVRLWSAGCASGEEAYSLAILLHEAAFPPTAHVLATDISRRALATARSASYRAWSFRGVDPSMVARHFQTHGNRHVLDPRIQARVHIERLNLALDVYPSMANGTWGIDLVLCRNVLIYFDQAAVRVVARRLRDCLVPGGWLFTGSSDPPINGEGLYETVVTPAGVLYRRGNDGTTRYAMAAVEEPPAPTQAVRATVAEAVGAREALAADEAVGAPCDPLDDATAAFQRGEYARVLALTQGLTTPEGAALRIRALANARGPTEAEREASDAALRFPLAAEIHLLRAVLLLAVNRHEEAVLAAKRSLYLDRNLAFGHFLLGLALSRLHDVDGARRALQHAREISSHQAPDDVVAFSDGQCAGRFAEAVVTQLDLLAGDIS
jgi:chemotaxis protein methyltransferase CheR